MHLIDVSGVLLERSCGVSGFYRALTSVPHGIGLAGPRRLGEWQGEELFFTGGCWYLLFLPRDMLCDIGTWRSGTKSGPVPSSPAAL